VFHNVCENPKQNKTKKKKREGERETRNMNASRMRNKESRPAHLMKQ
jgi:hypothetical protein